MVSIMPPAYKLIYFDVKGRAENIRYLFALAGVEYEDVRIKPVQEDWDKLKAKLPYGQLPVCEFGGNQYSQSHAIWRYLAREFGYYGNSNEDALNIDVVCELTDDLWPFCFKLKDAKEEEKISLADVMVFNMIYDIIPWLLDIKEGEYDLKDKDALKAFVERFKSNQRIADWISRRGQSPK